MSADERCFHGRRVEPELEAVRIGFGGLQGDEDAVGRRPGQSLAQGLHRPLDAAGAVERARPKALRRRLGVGLRLRGPLLRTGLRPLRGDGSGWVGRRLEGVECQPADAAAGKRLVDPIADLHHAAAGRATGPLLPASRSRRAVDGEEFEVAGHRHQSRADAGGRRRAAGGAELA